MFESLSSLNYRLFFWGQLISVCGTWMQTVAQSFLVLQLTNSGTDLGLATAARFVPILAFGPWGGLLADRLNKTKDRSEFECANKQYYLLRDNSQTCWPCADGANFISGAAKLWDDWY